MSPLEIKKRGRVYTVQEGEHREINLGYGRMANVEGYADGGHVQIEGDIDLVIESGKPMISTRNIDTTRSISHRINILLRKGDAIISTRIYNNVLMRGRK